MAEQSEKECCDSDSVTPMAVIDCSPCKLDSKNESATGYCQVCREYLCSSCVDCHSRVRLTRNHRLLKDLEFTEHVQSQDVVEDVQSETCERHEDQFVEYYCHSHELFGCGKCIIDSHRGCIMGSIDGLAKTFQDSIELKSLEATLEMIGESATQMAHTLQERMALAKDINDTCIRDVQTFHAAIIKSLKSQEEVLLQSSRERYEHTKTILDAAVNRNEQIRDEYVKLKENIQTSQHQAHKLFMTAKRAQKQVNILSSDNDDIKKKSVISKYCFKPSDPFQTVRETDQPSGNLVPTETTKHPPEQASLFTFGTQKFKGFAFKLDQTAVHVSPFGKPHIEEHTTTKDSNDTGRDIVTTGCADKGTSVNENASDSNKPKFKPAQGFNVNTGECEPSTLAIEHEVKGAKLENTRSGSSLLPIPLVEVGRIDLKNGQFDRTWNITNMSIISQDRFILANDNVLNQRALVIVDIRSMKVIEQLSVSGMSIGCLTMLPDEHVACLTMQKVNIVSIKPKLELVRRLTVGHCSNMCYADGKLYLKTSTSFKVLGLDGTVLKTVPTAYNYCFSRGFVCESRSEKAIYFSYSDDDSVEKLNTDGEVMAVCRGLVIGASGLVLLGGKYIGVCSQEKAEIVILYEDDGQFQLAARLQCVPNPIDIVYKADTKTIYINSIASDFKSKIFAYKLPDQFCD